MENMTAILVDDEERARDVLESLLKRYCPEVSIRGKFSRVREAVDFLKQEQVDLVFIDIEMPEYAGYELVNFFEKIDFSLVFVTAYDHYAIKAFELSAVDYLLKPIDVERLTKAVGKVRDQLYLRNQKEQLSVLKSTLESRRISNLIIAEKGLQHVLDLKSVLALEAHESYTLIYQWDKKYMASKNLKHFENLLEGVPGFFRAHKSWIVNMDYFENYSKSQLEIKLKNGMTAKLSKYKKPDFEALF